MKIALNLICPVCLLLLIIILHLLYLYNINKILKQAIKELCTMDNYDKGYFITGYEDGWIYPTPQEDIIYEYLKKDEFWGNKTKWEKVGLQKLHGEFIWNYKEGIYYDVNSGKLIKSKIKNISDITK